MGKRTTIHCPRGLTYSKDVFDIERFERIREIAAEMLSLQSEIPIEKGITRSYILHNGKDLIVKTTSLYDDSFSRKSLLFKTVL